MALDPLTAGIDLAGSIINKIWPDKSEQERAQLAAAVAVVQGQLDINKAEAASPSVFVAGWRVVARFVLGVDANGCRTARLAACGAAFMGLVPGCARGRASAVAGGCAGAWPGFLARAALAVGASSPAGCG